MNRLPNNLALAGLLLAVPPLARGQNSKILAQERGLLDKYQSRLDEISNEGLKSGFRASNLKLLALTNEDASPAMALVIANMLYALDPEDSYALHRRVYESDTNDSAPKLEWAMERHRRGEYAEAAALYSSYLEQVPADNIKQALLADCLVRTGDLPGAVAAWNRADQRNSHTGIDFAVFEIYGGLPPARRREDLLEKIHGGDNSLFPVLIYLDIHFDQDWWNTEPNQRTLALDLELAAKNLGGDSQQYQDLVAYSDIGKDVEMGPRTVKAILQKAGLVVGDQGRLPANSKIAHSLVEQVIEGRIETRRQLLDRFEKTLNDRARGNPGDADALNLLCYLYLDTDTDKLAEADRYGWEHFADAKFAGSYLAGKGALKADNPELQKALQQFPENGILRQMQLQVAGPDQATREMVVAAIKAQYRRMSGDSSNTLKGLFGLLEKQLGGASPK